jgi:hypothetical protein
MKQTPKEKAEELFDKFRTEILSFLGDRIKDQNAKRCALVAVNEIIDSHNKIQNFLFNEIGYLITRPEYWQEVKEEIEKL